MRARHRPLSPGWVAGSVRARHLLARRLGRSDAWALARVPSLDAALERLAGSPYGRRCRLGLSLADAQRAVAGTALWHVRVLAGWTPPRGLEPVRALAAWFEIANVDDRLAYLAGAEPRCSARGAAAAGGLGAGGSRRAGGAVSVALRLARPRSAVRSSALAGVERGPAHARAVLALELLERELEVGQRRLVRGDPAALDRVATQGRRAQLAGPRVPGRQRAPRAAPPPRARGGARRRRSSAQRCRPRPRARAARGEPTSASAGQLTPRTVRQRTVTVGRVVGRRPARKVDLSLAAEHGGAGQRALRLARSGLPDGREPRPPAARAGGARS